MRKIKIGTRESPLAIKQTQIVINLLQAQHGLFDYDIVGTKTLGDKLTQFSLKEIGGKGVFVKDIEAALLVGEIDIAIHSLKDMTYSLLEGLVIGAYPKRGSAFDVIIFNHPDYQLETLPAGSVIGTSSVRREMQILEQRQDVVMKDVRGKIETRLEKLAAGAYDALVLAEAGLERLDYLKALNYQRLSKDHFIPAIGQGILAVECRSEDYDILDFLKPINHLETQIAAEIEREFLGILNGNCEIPIAALARKKAEFWQLDAFLAKNRQSVGHRLHLQSAQPFGLGKLAANRLLKQVAIEKP
ncbi:MULTISPECIES: hydroxymethylbilane synthase [unclassified Enterococcus]|uniref:hydroxymethylbilane synthase n=1 Tax=unclassified Enterococcus TaxID=2608891 RepID=UPI0015523431|nr:MULTISPECIES: hydroxymethylbilane synthase [unclassified Enterococcus]MBS7576407.1 hydroxymethylbilane synthase [Enterococcus sp. MMGLQ5-2]MBS7583639.1 hydroxymethylbilane synthase [Enterococcus sp. MMGLQ5-1]NPD11500.1 hydroxymethylbilane synthase [Enterococcus sp. MMGLQ5-1]NPD36244.1 hydroxymethylbilane synthase [Enterococcus sp. MMGLQ5-2]